MTIPLKVRRVIEEVSRRRGVPVAELYGRKRDRKISAVRQEAFAELRLLSWGCGHPSYPLIGGWLGRDHSTVRHGILMHYRRCTKTEAAL